MKIIKRIVGVFTGIMCITSVTLAFTHKPIAVFLVEAVLFGVATFFLMKPKGKKTSSEESKESVFTFPEEALKAMITISSPVNPPVNSTISSTVNRDAIELNALEQEFFQAFLDKLTLEERSQLVLNRLSSGAIEPCIRHCPLGKVKLTGRKHWMQVFKNMMEVEVFEGNLQEMIEKQDETIKYLREYCEE